VLHIHVKGGRQLDDTTIDRVGQIMFSRRRLTLELVRLFFSLFLVLQKMSEEFALSQQG
jgi:hypothetical protein